MQGLGQLCRVPVPLNVHVHHSGSLVKYVVMDRRLLDTSGLKLSSYRSYFILGQHQIAHHHGAVPRVLECQPPAERKRGFDLYVSHSDVQIRSGQTHLVNIPCLNRASSAELLRDGLPLIGG